MLFKKITILFSICAVVVLIALAYNYFLVSEYKLITSEKVGYLLKAADNFSLYGSIICLLMLLWINVASYKTNNLYLLWIPFAFIVFVAVISGYNAEDIFIFKKENGLWKGGFSISYFASAAVVIFAAIVIGINYIILKKILK